MVRRSSYNEIKSFEVGGTSNWYVYMESGGGRAPSPNSFNLLGGSPSRIPATEVSYQSVTTAVEGLELAPSQVLSIPVGIPYMDNKVSVTVIDDYLLSFRSVLWDWMYQYSRQSDYVAIPIHKLKDYAMKMTVVTFTQNGLENHRRSFYILPPTELTEAHDSNFGIETYPISFPVIGTESH